MKCNADNTPLETTCYFSRPEQEGSLPPEWCVQSDYLQLPQALHLGKSICLNGAYGVIPKVPAEHNQRQCEQKGCRGSDRLSVFKQ